MKEKEMHVQVEVECAKCSRKLKADIPVVCDLSANKVLECDVVGNLSDHVPPCKCGSKDFKVDKKELIKKLAQGS